MSRNYELITSEFLRIKNLGYVKNQRPNNDGGVGNTFEDLLGVEENNQKAPDFDGFEIKNQRTFSKSFVSLCTKKPTSKEYGDDYMRQTFGVEDKEYPSIKCFRTSIYGTRWSHVNQKAGLDKQLKIKLQVDYENKKIIFVVADLNENIINKNVFWAFDDIRASTKKLSDLFVVKADVIKESGAEYYSYDSASVYLGFKGVDHFIKLIADGVIRYDNRLGIYRKPKNPNMKGKPHNHGGGFRIKASDIDKMYEETIRIN